MINKLKNKRIKAFTLIELIVVIAVIGILVLLAAPKLLGYTKDAKLAQIKNDIKAYENAIEVERINDDEFLVSQDWDSVDKSDLEEFVDSNSLFNKKGLISKDGNVEKFNDEYLAIPKADKLIKTKLKGQFYLAKGGEVFYHEEGIGGQVPGLPEYTVTFIGGDGEVVEQVVVEEGGAAEAPEAPEKHNGKYFVGWDKDYNDVQEDLTVKAQYETRYYTVTFQHEDGAVIDEQKVAEGESAIAPNVPDEMNGLIFKGWDNTFDNIVSDVVVVSIYTGPTDVDLDMVSDFEWVNQFGTGQVNSDNESGYFKYIGTGQSVVEIPHVIQGAPVTSYYRMFNNTGKDVQEVVSANDKVTNMGLMFDGSQVTSLTFGDKFDTSNVTDMRHMFRNFQAESLDLSSFDTGKVTDMSNMFYQSQTISLTGLDKFNTSSVTDMNHMFSSSQAKSLNLSSFDTKSVTNMSYMFDGSRATSLTGLDKFNTSNVTKMNAMFQKAQATTLDLSSFDTSNVTDMSNMFWGSQANPIKTKDSATANKFIYEGSATQSRVKY